MENVNTAKRVVCRHGVDNSLEIVTAWTDAGWVVKATQMVCSKCLKDLGVDLAANNRAVVAEFDRSIGQSFDLGQYPPRR